MTQKQESEHLPHSAMMDLKHNLEALKKKISQPDSKSHELILEIESMKDAVHQLNVVFEKALKEMKEEDITKTFHSLMEKVNTIAVQNETIAKGMVALADRLEDYMSRPGMPTRSMAAGQHSMGAPALSGRMAPRPEMSMPSEPTGFPPPPSPANRKTRVGLFS